MYYYHFFCTSEINPISSHAQSKSQLHSSRSSSWTTSCYYYTGGRIRDGLKLLRGRLKFQTFREISLAMIDGLGNESLDLAAGGQYGSKDKNSIDSLRTYFKAKKITLPTQIDLSSLWIRHTI